MWAYVIYFKNTEYGFYVMKIVKLGCALLLSAFISVTHANVIHVTDGNGNLLGAENVLVDGTLYDVTFSKGSCIALYKGCDDLSDFVFSTQASSVLASTALLDTVFIDTGAVNFDTNHLLMANCTFVNFCAAVTPFFEISDQGVGHVYVATNVAINYGLVFNSYDAVAPRNFFNTELADLTPYAGYFYAVWTPVDVPEPSTLILLSLGLAGLSFSRYRKQS
jgi:hypothetical protein